MSTTEQMSTTVSSKILYKVTKAQKISNCATQVKRMGNIIKEAQEVVFDRKQRCSKHMRKVIENAAVHNRNIWDKNEIISDEKEYETKPQKRGLSAITGELGNESTAMKKSCKEMPQRLRKDIDHVQPQTMRVKETTIRVPQDASSPVDIDYWCDSNSECASLQSHRNSQPEFVQLLSKESTLLSVKESGKFSCDRKEPPPAISRMFEKMSGGSGENIFKTNKQGSGAGGAQIPFAQIQPNNRMIMIQLKSRLKQNITNQAV